MEISSEITNFVVEHNPNLTESFQVERVLRKRFDQPFTANLFSNEIHAQNDM